MVFNATFNNISVIPWRSVLLVEEIGVPGSRRKPPTCRKSLTNLALSHNVVHLALIEIRKSSTSRPQIPPPVTLIEFFTEKMPGMLTMNWMHFYNNK